MLTVVLKLLNLTRPDAAFFGEKDYQQLTLIRRMVADLDVPTEIVGVPTVREPDGPALSSRNRYLDAAGRASALALSRARVRLLIFGDPGTLVRRTQWEGALDHLDAVAGGREREVIAHLVRYLQGHGSHPQVFSLREGNPA